MSFETVSLESLAAAEPGAITDGPFGSNLTSAHYTTEGPQVVRLQNIGDGAYKRAEAHISQRHFESLRKHEVRGGDLIVASLGNDLPRACLMPGDIGPAIVKADCIRVRLSPHVDPRWVLYALQSPDARSWAKDQLHGVGRPRLGLKTIRQIPVPITTLHEQRRIVEILEDHLSHIDAGEDGIDRVGLRLGALESGHAAALLRGLDGPLSTVGQISRNVKNGLFVSRSTQQTSGVPILRIGSVRPLSLDLANSGLSGLLDHEVDAAGGRLTFGDVLFTRYNGNPNLVASAAVVPEDGSRFTYPDKLIRVRVDPELVRPQYLAVAATWGPLRDALRSRVKTTSGQAGISGADLKSAPLRIPSLASQDQALAELSRVLEESENLKIGLVRARQRSASLRRALLTAAFSGKLTGAASDSDRIEELATTT